MPVQGVQLDWRAGAAPGTVPRARLPHGLAGCSEPECTEAERIEGRNPAWAGNAGIH